MVDNLIMILVVHAGIAVFYLLMRLKSPVIVRKGYIGYYMVLMPIAFFAWMHPMLWYAVGLSLIGLIVISIAAQRIIEERGTVGK